MTSGGRQAVNIRRSTVGQQSVNSRSIGQVNVNISVIIIK